MQPCMRPKFELVLDTLEKELGGLGIGTVDQPATAVTLFPLIHWMAVQRQS